MSSLYRVDAGMGRLPCGRLYDDLLEQVADHLEPADPAHQATCPHCRATLAELGDLWTPMHGWVESDTVLAPESLTANIMERVSAMASNTWYALVVEHPGINRIASWVVALVARRAALVVPGVSSVRGRAEPSDTEVDSVRLYFSGPAPTPVQRLSAAGTGVAGRRVVVNMLVTADGTVPLPFVAHGIRRAVTDLVQALTGLDVIEINIEFDGIDIEEFPDDP